VNPHSSTGADRANLFGFAPLSCMPFGAPCWKRAHAPTPREQRIPRCSNLKKQINTTVRGSAAAALVSLISRAEVFSFQSAAALVLKNSARRRSDYLTISYCNLQSFRKRSLARKVATTLCKIYWPIPFSVHFRASPIFINIRDASLFCVVPWMTK
jgi:hypothetical protein